MMTTKKCCAFVLFAFAIGVGCLSDSLMAQQSYSGHDHSGSCASGCDHDGGGESLELIPYGNSAAPDTQARFAPQPYRGQPRGGMGYDRNYRLQQFENRPSCQGAYENPDVRGSRGNYRTRREDFGYADKQAAEFSGRKQHGHPGCRGGCSHDHRGVEGRGGETDGGGNYEGNNRRPEAGRELPYDNEADVRPQLNMDLLGRENQAAFYRRSSPSWSDR